MKDESVENQAESSHVAPAAAFSSLGGPSVLVV
jgi:hypothetical protein